MRAITTVVAAASLLCTASGLFAQSSLFAQPGLLAQSGRTHTSGSPVQTTPQNAPASAQPAAGQTWTWKELALKDRRSMAYAVVLPKDYKAGDPYPVLLVMPPGTQSKESVEQAMAKYWSIGGERGWIVISPASPDTRPLHAGNAAAVDELIDFALREYKPAGGKLHLAGVSNGGRTAWGAILEHPESFASLTVLPGLPPDTMPAKKVAALKGTPITMFAGEKDKDVARDSQRVVDRLKRDGVEATLTVEPGQGHVIESLTPTRLFDLLDAYRAGHGTSGLIGHDAGLTPSVVSAAIGRVLDDFHDAAAKADEKRYFDHAASEFVFIGTDPTERWNLEEFKSFAKPYFARGKAWTYVPIAGKRSVVFAPDGSTAFFDELLTNDLFGTCRGTGAVRKIGNDWKIVQYSLSVPIPNAKMTEVVNVIKK
jgi:predicted esterase